MTEVYREVHYLPNHGLKHDHTIKDEHLAQAIREMEFTSSLEEIYKRAAMIAAKEMYEIR